MAYIGAKRALLGGKRIRWLLRDDFNDTLAAGSVNGTPATPGTGTRVIVDTGTKISIGSGLLNFATGATANDGLWLDVITRTAGRLMVTQLTPADTSGIPATGWDSNQTGAILDHLKLTTTTGIQVVANGGTAITVGAYSATSYNIVGMMRATGIHWFIKGGAFTNWTLIYITAAGSGNAYPGVQALNTTSVFTSSLLRVPSKLWLPTPLASDGFSAATTDGLGHAEGVTGGIGAGGGGQTWTGATYSILGGKVINTPTEGGELLADGEMETWDSATDLHEWTESIAGTSTVNREDTVIHGGTYACRFDVDAGGSAVQIRQGTPTVGQWIVMSAWMKSSADQVGAIKFGTNALYHLVSLTTDYQQFIRTMLVPTGSASYDFRRETAPSLSLYIDDVSYKPLILSSLFRSLVLSTADVILTAKLVLSYDTQIGVVLNLDSAAAPANFVIAFLDGRSNCSLIKCVAGVYTTLISAAVAYVADAQIRVIKDGTSYQLFYNNLVVGTTQTIADAGIVGNKIHGLFNTSPLNTFDNLTVYARGNGGEYNVLNKFTR